jgi:hypothetical protein
MTRTMIAASAGALLLALAGGTRAHCDGLDGPVVAAARRALDSGDPDLVLVWVQPADEAQIRAALKQAATVRKLGGEAKQLAETWFFETLVRIHRAGEGAPYTGLKPAGRDLGAAIPAADKALQSGDVKPLQKMLSDSAAAGVRARFAQAMALKKFDKADVATGRKYVEAYVAFVHYVERLEQASSQESAGHFAEEEPASHHTAGEAGH